MKMLQLFIFLLVVVGGRTRTGFIDNGEAADNVETSTKRDFGANPFPSTSTSSGFGNTGTSCSSAEPCVHVKGRQGYNDKINGEYVLQPGTEGGRPFYYNSDEGMYIYWKEDLQYWLIGKPLGTTDVAAYCHHQGDTPDEGDSVWVVWDDKDWIPDIKIEVFVPGNQEPAADNSNSAFSSFGGNVQVTGRTGFNSNINGVYVQSGTEAGKPYYYYSDGEMYIYWFEDRKYWMIGETLGSTDAFAYGHHKAATPDYGHSVWMVFVNNDWVPDSNIEVSAAGNQGPAADDTKSTFGNFGSSDGSVSTFDSFSDASASTFKGFASFDDSKSTFGTFGDGSTSTSDVFGSSDDSKSTFGSFDDAPTSDFKGFGTSVSSDDSKSTFGAFDDAPTSDSKGFGTSVSSDDSKSIFGSLSDATTGIFGSSDDSKSTFGSFDDGSASTSKGFGSSVSSDDSNPFGSLGAWTRSRTGSSDDSKSTFGPLGGGSASTFKGLRWGVAGVSLGVVFTLVTMRLARRRRGFATIPSVSAI